MIFNFTLTGKTPLIMHADDMEGQALKEWRKNPDNKAFSVPGDDRSPAWTWTTYLHHDSKRVAMPSDVVMATLREAGKQMILKGTKTFKGQTQSGLYIADEFCELTSMGKPVLMADVMEIKEKEFSAQANLSKEIGVVLFGKRGTVGQSKHFRVRPRFNVWEVTGQIEITDPVITESILNKLFEIAGKKCGFLDWRPNAKSPGPYGQFTHKLVQAA